MSVKRFSRVKGKGVVYAHIDEELAEDIRKLAKRSGHSISFIVEEFVGYCVANGVFNKIVASKMVKER